MKNIIITIIIALIAGAIGANLFTPETTDNKVKKESAYERVMRTGKIKCGYFLWAPFLSMDPNTRELSGISYDYIQAISKELDLKIEWAEEVGVGDYVAGLNAGRFDVMCMSLWPDGPRLKNSTLTKPLFYSTVFAVVKADDNRFRGDLDLLNKDGIKISAIDGDITYTIAKNMFSKAETVALPQMSDSSHLLQYVVSGKADVTFVDSGIVQDFNKSNNSKVKIVEGTNPVKVFPEVLAVQKDEWKLKNLLDATIDIINNNRVPEKILKKYDSSTYPTIIQFDESK